MKTICTTLAILMTICVQAQTSDEKYTIPLMETAFNAGEGAILGCPKVPHDSCPQNVPPIQCDSFDIFYFYLTIDNKKKNKNELIHVFSGIDKKLRKKYVAVDINRNLDFSDDPLCCFPFPDQPLEKRQKLERCVSMQLPVDSAGQKFLHIGIDPSGLFATNEMGQNTDVAISISDYMTGNFTIRNTPVEIDGDFGTDFSRKELNATSSFLFRYTDSKGNRLLKSIRQKDTLHIEDELYRISEIKHPAITLEPIATLPDSSRAGSYLPVINVQDLKQNRTVRLNQEIENKYAFIHFGGSWCNPGVAAIPYYKALYDKIKNRKDAVIIGIASEHRTDLDKLKKQLEEKEVKWKNYWIDRKTASHISSVTGKLDISAFPTYLVVDKNGKIVYRNSSSLHTEEAIKFFLNLIDKKILQ